MLLFQDFDGALEHTNEHGKPHEYKVWADLAAAGLPHTL